MEREGGEVIFKKKTGSKARPAIGLDGEKACRRCVRGILCITCNVHLGFHENRDWVSRANKYLSGAVPFSDEEAGAVAC